MSEDEWGPWTFRSSGLRIHATHMAPDLGHEHTLPAGTKIEGAIEMPAGNIKLSALDPNQQGNKAHIEWQIEKDELWEYVDVAAAEQMMRTTIPPEVRGAIGRLLVKRTMGLFVNGSAAPAGARGRRAGRLGAPRRA